MQYADERKFEQMLRDEQSDRQLRELAIKAKKHLPRTIERRRALNELINLIRQSKRIGHPQRSLWNAGIYEELYAEAFQETLIIVCQKIDRYQSKYPFMAWFNKILARRFSDTVKKYNKKGITYIPENQEKSSILSLDELEIFTLENAKSEDPISEACTDEQMFKDFLETDPEGLLRSHHIKERPDITFQRVILANLVDDKTWDELSKELRISISTLSSFYQRTLRKLKPYFLKYLKDNST